MPACFTCYDVKKVQRDQNGDLTRAGAWAAGRGSTPLVFLLHIFCAGTAGTYSIYIPFVYFVHRATYRALDLLHANITTKTLVRQSLGTAHSQIYEYIIYAIYSRLMHVSCSKPIGASNQSTMFIYFSTESITFHTALMIIFSPVLSLYDSYANWSKCCRPRWIVRHSLSAVRTRQYFVNYYCFIRTRTIESRYTA